MSVGKRVYLSYTYHCLIIVLAHGDGLLRWHHVPQTIAAQDDVAVFFGVEDYYASVWLGRNYKLPTVEVIAPKISCCRETTLNKTTAYLDKHYNHSLSEIDPGGWGALLVGNFFFFFYLAPGLLLGTVSGRWRCSDGLDHCDWVLASSRQHGSLQISWLRCRKKKKTRRALFKQDFWKILLFFFYWAQLDGVALKKLN